MQMISAFVITKNESANISKCLASLQWADEVIVVDANSDDDTVDIAERIGARVFRRAWTGYSDQRNFAIDQCRGDWILYMDADEVPGPGFAEEARDVERGGGASAAGYYVSTLEFFMGDFLRHGGFGLHQANKKVRFWRAAPEHRFAGDVHERVTISGPVGTFRSYVEHRSTASTISGLLAKLNRYSDLEPEVRAVRARDLVIQPSKVMLARFVRHGGFRDGTRGFIVAQLHAIYSFLTVAKQMERNLR